MITACFVHFRKTARTAPREFCSAIEHKAAWRNTFLVLKRQPRSLPYPFANTSSDNMTDAPEYTPPEVWVWEKDDSPEWRYSNTNRPIAGATHEKELPRGKH